MPLLKNHISDIEIYSEKWKTARLGKFTSSNMWKLMGAKGFGETGLNYIRDKVFEELSGVSSEKEVDNDATRWGHLYEPEALNRFGLQMGCSFLVTGKLIQPQDSRFSGTPDGLWLQNEIPEKEAYNVFNVEAKCYEGKHHIQICQCVTPQQVKENDPKLFWQVIHQSDLCGSLKGYSVNYHPLLKVSSLKIIEYRKVELIEDFKLLEIRKKMAEDKFNEIRNDLLKN